MTSSRPLPQEAHGIVIEVILVAIAFAGFCRFWHSFFFFWKAAIPDSCMQVWTAALPCSSCTWKPSRVRCAEARHAPTHSAIQSPRSPPCCFCEKSYRNDFVFLLTLHSVFDEKIKPSMFVLGCIPNIFKKKKKKSHSCHCAFLLLILF